MRKKKREEEHENSERWLITYADLITLLLAFFILMYTMSKQDAQRYQEVAGHLKAVFTGGIGVAGRGSTLGKTPTELSFKGGDGSGVRELERQIKGVDEQSKGATAGRITVFADDRGIIVRAMEKAFFDEGKADLSDQAEKALDAIAPVIKSMNSHLRVEGHTDNVPIRTSEFKSNWELSVMRATEVVRYLIERHNFPPDKISAAGYSEYRPIVSNENPKNRGLNRRIEMIIVKSEEAKKLQREIVPQGNGQKAAGL
jgi:chemotaxis protein MotB